MGSRPRRGQLARARPGAQRLTQTPCESLRLKRYSLCLSTNVNNSTDVKAGNHWRARCAMAADHWFKVVKIMDKASRFGMTLKQMGSSRQ
eukprot:2851671-Heterocapsa_arctica.AAC.1